MASDVLEREVVEGRELLAKELGFASNPGGGSGLRPANPARSRSNPWEITGALSGQLPSRIELPHPFEPWNQALLPCCVSCAISVCMETLDARDGVARRLSPLFNYWFARPFRDTLSAVEVQRALRSASTHGISPPSHHPVDFTREGARREPSADAIEEAKQLRLRYFPEDDDDHTELYFDLSNPTEVADWLRPLAAGFPMIVGFRPGASYWELREQGREVLSTSAGGNDFHAAVAIGYDRNALGPKNGAIRIKDSRGAQFGMKGEWWLPFELVQSGFSDEVWVLTTISNQSQETT